MTDTEELDMLGALKDASDIYHHAIFGTYTFQAPFFEERVLRALQDRDAANIMVLVDPDEYRSLESVSLAGHAYYLDFCEAARTFHPKFILTTWGNGARLAIGSANLGEASWQTTGELVTDLFFDLDRPDEAVAQAMADFAEFLSALMDQGYLKSPKHQERLAEVVTDLKELLPNNLQPTAEAPIRVLHNLEAPLLPQLLEEVEGDEIRLARLMAPFYDPQLTVVHQLAEAGCDRIELYLSEDDVQGFRASALSGGPAERVEVEIYTVDFPEDPGRYLHAKALVVETGTRSIGLFGSPNMTKAAMLSTPADGNLEIATLRLDAPGHFDEVFGGDTLSVQPINPEDVEFRAQDDMDKDRPEASFLLNEARAYGGELTIEFDPPFPWETAEVHLESPGEAEGLVKAVDAKEEGRIVVSVKGKLSDLLKGSAFVRVELSGDAGTATSVERWVTTSHLETQPTSRDRERIQESGGTKGVIPLARRLLEAGEDPYWAYVFLQDLDLSDIEGSYGRAKSSYVAKFEDHDPEGGEGEGRGKVTIEDVADAAERRTQRQIEDATNTLEVDEELAWKLERLLNGFISLSKLTIWMVNDAGLKPERLVNTKANIKRMSDCARRLAADDENVDVATLLDGLLYVEHLLIVGHLVRRAQVLTGYARRPRNRHVIQAFARGLYDSVEPWLSPADSGLGLEIGRIEAACKAYVDLGSKLAPTAEDVIDSWQAMADNGADESSH